MCSDRPRTRHVQAASVRTQISYAQPPAGTESTQASDDVIVAGVACGQNCLESPVDRLPATLAKASAHFGGAPEPELRIALNYDRSLLT